MKKKKLNTKGNMQAKNQERLTKLNVKIVVGLSQLFLL